MTEHTPSLSASTEAEAGMVARVVQYLAHRRALGYRLYTDGYLLRSFARYAEGHAPGRPLTTKLALEWATEPKATKRLYHAKRLDALRSFARYLVILDPHTEVPPAGLLGPSCARSEPHIYTPEETAALMRAALAMKPVTRDSQANPLRNMTILGLLACTGMRVGEVLALKNDDVDLTQGVITVRESKNLPMRLVPVTDCTVRRLLAYRDARDRCSGPAQGSEAFFRSAWGGHTRYGTIYHIFKRIRRRAGLSERRASGRRPCIHDLRHTFACTHLLRAYREHRNIDNAVHELSVYLGHARLEATYWYLTGTPALFAECLKRFEAHGRERGEET